MNRLQVYRWTESHSDLNMWIDVFCVWELMEFNDFY